MMKISIKKMDMPLTHVLDLDTISLYLYNLGMTHEDVFDMDWTKVVQEMMQNEATNKLEIWKSLTHFMLLKMQYRRCETYNTLISNFNPKAGINFNEKYNISNKKWKTKRLGLKIL